jgi:hypothetical protein
VERRRRGGSSDGGSGRIGDVAALDRQYQRESGRMAHVKGAHLVEVILGVTVWAEVRLGHVRDMVARVVAAVVAAHSAPEQRHRRQAEAGGPTVACEESEWGREWMVNGGCVCV